MTRWTEDEEKQPPEAGHIPTCPDCDMPMHVIKQTPVSDTVEVVHYGCPNGHEDVASCHEHLEHCRYDSVNIKGGAGGGCNCPCPSCGSCSSEHICICRQGTVCAEKLMCMTCSTVFVCEKGQVCPYCCGRTNIYYVKDATGNYVVENGYLKTINYCKKCKKGHEASEASHVASC